MISSHDSQPVTGGSDIIVERRYRRPFILVTSLFFAWAFAASASEASFRPLGRRPTKVVALVGIDFGITLRVANSTQVGTRNRG